MKLVTKCKKSLTLKSKSLKHKLRDAHLSDMFSDIYGYKRINTDIMRLIFNKIQFNMCIAITQGAVQALFLLS